ncbi:tRNA(Ile)-lysidine synthetase [Fibrobacteres bacterium R8-0-B4]
MPHAPANPFPETAAFFDSVGASPSAPVSVAVGVSGGADSIALLHILCLYRADFGIGRLAAAHVNHGLRGAESDGDEEFVRNEAEKLGVEFFSVRLDHPDNSRINTDNADNSDNIDNDGGSCGSGIEAWARRERYKFFSSVRREQGIDFIATAHTADDQAETVLLRLTRGAGLRGLRGILPVRGDGVIRPILGIERRRLSEWLSARGVGHRVDSSNADLRFRRNRIRAEVVPKLLECDPAAVRNIAAAAAAAQAAWGEIEGRVGEWIDRYALRVSPDIFHVEKAGLADEGGAAESVREALLVLFDEHGIPPSRLHIELAAAALSGTLSGVEHLLPGGWSMYCRNDRVCFVKRDV